MIERYRTIQRQRAAGELDASGFTLIELLIVIVVLGILAAVVVFALGGVTGQSAASACSADAKTVQTALAAYEAQSSTAPTAVTAITNTGGGDSYLVTGYLQSWPVNTGANYAISISAGASPSTPAAVVVTVGGSWNSTGTTFTGGAAAACSTAT
jgi:general secretion pathway protein G